MFLCVDTTHKCHAYELMLSSNMADCLHFHMSSFCVQLGYCTPQLVGFLSRAARDLFNSISAVHPFVISVLLQRVQQDIEAVADVRDV